MDVDQAMVFGLLVPFLGTALGAAVALGLPTGSKGLCRCLTGFAGGAMLAACIWSLLLPGLEQGFWMTAAGFGAGMLLLLAPERLPRGRMDPAAMLILAVVLHNIPEGMAVGAGYAGWRTGADVASGDAMALAFGIALQNVPDGAVIALPLAALGMKRWKAFGAGVLSGAVEPVAAGLMMAFAPALTPLLPVFLGFAGGAMMYVVLRELVPQMGDGALGTVCFAAGFLMMMAGG